MDNARPFDKPATTYSEQLKILKARGMIFADEKKALFYLEHLNYYRLCAYWLPCETNHQNHSLKPQTTFDSVLDLYRFDRELRLLVLDAIERIEVSVRAHWAYAMAHESGPHAHLQEKLAVNQDHWKKNIEDLRKEVERADEVFIRHLRTNYSNELPPRLGGLRDNVSWSTFSLV